MAGAASAAGAGAAASAGVAAILDRANASLPGGGAAKRAFYSARKGVWRVAETDENPAGYARCAEPRAALGARR